MERFKYAGKILKIKKGTGYSSMGELLDGKEIIVEDYWMNINGRSWKNTHGSPAVLEYCVRALNKRTLLPMDDEVVYGKVGYYGHLLHVSELVLPGEREPIVHSLKIDQKYYEEVLTGKKKFEVRRNDRDFQVGDLLNLHEIEKGGYTGRSFAVEVTYILDDPQFCKENYVIMSISNTNKARRYTTHGVM